MSNRTNVLIPGIGVITDVRRDTPDVKTFRVNGSEGRKPFKHMPGQCAMLSIPGVGEAMFSITSSPTNRDYMEFSIKKCGCLTDWLHQMEEGQEIALRGPYGNYFPVDTDLKGKNLLFIAGGIGIAPLRSVIHYVIDHRADYGLVDIVYGARSAEDLVDLEEMRKDWSNVEGFRVHLTIDRAEEGWEGNVAFVPDYVRELKFSNDRTALVCGPPVMIKFVLQALEEMGFASTEIYTTMELKMKCGVGKCGRCNIGSKYVCKDGPVFRYDELGVLPSEY
ncbi:MAG: FAD/NAD(P)-binding protein [Lacrimispora sphenoides]